MNKNAIRAIPLMSFDTSGLTGGYDFVGVLPEACYVIHLYNNSKTNVTVSYDGLVDHEAVPQDHTTTVMGGTIVSNNVAYLPKGMRFYVKGAAGVGHVYISGYYVKQVI